MITMKELGKPKTVKEVFKENRGESILEECPKTSEEIWRIASTEVERRLSEHDFVLGFNTDGNLGIGNVKSGLVPIEKPLYIKNKLTVEEEIDEFCKKLPRYKRPRKLIFAKVPRNPTGKIEKPKLREKYGAAHLVAAQNQVEIK